MTGSGSIVEVVVVRAELSSGPESTLQAALSAADSSVRMRAVMQAGTHPSPGHLAVLIAQCAVEPDFYVRDTLTWALTRHDPAVTVDLLLAELSSSTPQARSQALHTLSKIGDGRAWPAITPALLQDADDEVARAAWRTAAGLVPVDQKTSLAEILATQFGRGGRDVQLSLSRAFVVLGGAASEVVERATRSADDHVRRHALATEHLLQNPDDGFDASLADAQRVMVLRGAPLVEG